MLYKTTTCELRIDLRWDGRSYSLLIHAPITIGVYCFCRWLCLSVCLLQTFLLFCFSMESSHFGHQLSITKTTKVFPSIFDLNPLTPIIYSPKFSYAGHWVNHSLWVIVCGSKTFGLGVEIHFAYRLVQSFLCSSSENATMTELLKLVHICDCKIYEA